jgi:peptidoglycan/LPS O-acetylase OafA/YrhL
LTVTRERWRITSGRVAVAGGLAWIAKLTVIVATGGEIIDTGPAALFYVSGVALLLFGGALTGLWYTTGRGLLMRIAGATIGIVGFLVSFAILDTIGGGVVGERGPEYAAAEIGILLTAILWLAIGLWLSFGGTHESDAHPAEQPLS